MRQVTVRAGTLPGEVRPALHGSARRALGRGSRRGMARLDSVRPENMTQFEYHTVASYEPLARTLRLRTQRRMVRAPGESPSYYSLYSALRRYQDMTGNRGKLAAARLCRGQMRASHADREQVIDVLKAAFVQGRLTKSEFDVRVDRALVLPTYADLAAVTADIPAGPAAVRPPQGPARSGAWPSSARPVVNTLMMLTAGLLIAGLFYRPGPGPVSILGLVLCWTWLGVILFFRRKARALAEGQRRG